MDETTILGAIVERVTGVPASVSVLVLGLGSYIRDKIKRRREERRERQDRAMKSEVERQLDFIYSAAYIDMESRVYHLHHKGEKDLEVRRREDIERVPFGAYKTNYKDSLKEVAFKQVLKCIMGKLKDDKKHYMGKHFERYVMDTGEDIQKTFVGALGRKVGITEFSKFVEEDTLNIKVFQDMYGKIIRRARGK